VGGGFGERLFAIKRVAQIGHEDGGPLHAVSEGEVFGKIEMVGDGIAFMAGGDGARGAAGQVNHVLPINKIAIGAVGETHERGVHADEVRFDLGREFALRVGDGFGSVFVAPDGAFEKLAEDCGRQRVRHLVGDAQGRIGGVGGAGEAHR